MLVTVKKITKKKWEDLWTFERPLESLGCFALIVFKGT